MTTRRSFLCAALSCVAAMLGWRKKPSCYADGKSYPAYNASTNQVGNIVIAPYGKGDGGKQKKLLVCWVERSGMWHPKVIGTIEGELPL